MTSVFIDVQVTDDVDWIEPVQLGGQTDGTTARRNLEDAIRIIRRVILLALAVVIGGIVVAGCRVLFECVVNAMRRGVKKEKQQ